MNKKDKSKIICGELRKSIFGFKDNEDIYVAAIWDGLNEIERLENEVEAKRCALIYEQLTKGTIYEKSKQN